MSSSVDGTGDSSTSESGATATTASTTLKRKASTTADSDIDTADRAKRRPSESEVSRPRAHPIRAEIIPPTTSFEEQLHHVRQSRQAEQQQNGFISPNIPAILPHGKVFPIQIGTELFQLSGASISSDAPSYFSNFFEQQLKDDPDATIRTLYIDRDPDTFRDICLHLQGYYSPPRDAAHFVRMFADAQFYSLPRLVDLLFQSEILIRIGGRDFAIPRDIFSAPGDSPNFFTLGFGVFFTSPVDAFPGVRPQTLLRPPSIHPPSLSNRSADVFNDLLTLLRGYDLHIRDEEHRSALIRDCKYFHLRGLEQRLVKHATFFDPRSGRDQIVIRLEDIKPSGVSMEVGQANENFPGFGWLKYARPYADTDSRDLIVEITTGDTALDVGRKRFLVRGSTRTKLNNLLQAVAKSVKLTAPELTDLALMPSNGGVIRLNGKLVDPLSEQSDKMWHIHRGQFRITATQGRTLEFRVMLILVEATSNEAESILRRGFLEA